MVTNVAGAPQNLYEVLAMRIHWHINKWTMGHLTSKAPKTAWTQLASNNSINALSLHKEPEIMKDTSADDYLERKK